MSEVIRRRYMGGGAEDVDPATLPNKYLTFYAREAGTFSFSKTGLKYSLNGKSWKSLGANTPSVVVPAGSYIYFRGNASSTGTGIGTFSSSGAFDALGNVNSLIYDKEAEENTVMIDDGQYAYLFSNCIYLVNTNDLKLPKSNLRSRCYMSMFNRCTNLVSAPKLEATSLAVSCYESMFNNCISLVVAPELPATTLASTCYGSMFHGCSALNTAPAVLPAQTLVASCYRYMFYDCTSLTTAPSLPATTLVSDCYLNMFRGCSQLNYIKAMFRTTPSLSYTNNWVMDVAATGTFVKSTAATWNVSGVNGVPNGWTIQTLSIK